MDNTLLTDFLRRAIVIKPQVIPHLSEQARELLGLKADNMGYPPIRDAYWTSIYGAVEGYLTNDRPVTSYRNAASVAMSEAFTATVYEAWYQAGAELPLSDDVSAWLAERIGQERGHIISMFDRLKAEWQGLDVAAEAVARADGYSRTLDSLYGEAKMRAAKNATLEFVGDDGAESCPECQSMKGKRHTIKYIIEHNLIPRPGNDVYSCNGYHCEHFWQNPKTGERFDG